jgi:glycosyltransferase involved in cell wall biosynthesis
VSRIRVLQITDTLESGGAERVAVNFANLLPRDRFASWLCTTRSDGPLAALVGPDVQRIALERRARFDLPPLRRLASMVAEQRIDIMHAHGSSLFVALAASLRAPRTTLIWHVHHLHQRQEWTPWAYRLVAARTAAVVAVSEQVAEWVRRRMRVPNDRIVYLPNFSINTADGVAAPALPGQRGTRFVSVANIRPQKDQRTLVEAFARVVRREPAAHLLLVGATTDAAYRALVEADIARLNLQPHVTLLGERDDVPAILRECDIAVLSSATEGFPLSLVEYGQAGLPVVATRVGQCADVLEGGDAGLLVSPGNADQLAAAMLSLWHSRAQRRLLSARLRRRVEARYASPLVIDQLCGLYERLVRRSGPSQPDAARRDERAAVC